MAGVTMDELGRRLTDLDEPTRTESACLNYDLHRSNEDPATGLLYQKWKSSDDFDAHFKTRCLREFLADLPSLLSEDLKTGGFTMTSALAAT
jgi:quinol monooxygenase YgiN